MGIGIKAGVPGAFKWFWIFIKIFIDCTPIPAMATQVKKRRKVKKISLNELLPDMLASAIANEDDFIVTYETHPDDGKQDIHILRGKLITPCMLGTLKNRVEIQQEEGSTIMTLHWGKSRSKNVAGRDGRKVS
jgi:hypothetical protein